MEEDRDDISVGSYFAKKKADKGESYRKKRDIEVSQIRNVFFTASNQNTFRDVLGQH